MVRLVPIYVYRCSNCNREFEEIQRLDEAAPATPTDGCPNAAASCPLERQMTTASHRFRADYSSDGVGGYVRQGDAMIRQVKGKSGENYGSDRSGRG